MRIWLKLRAFTIKKHALVRGFANNQTRFLRLLNKPIESGSTLAAGPPDDYQTLKKITNLRNTVINRILIPLSQGETPLNKINTLESFQLPDNFDKTELTNALEDTFEDVIVFIRKHRGELRDLEKSEHPSLGQISAKVWLYWLYCEEKKALKGINERIGLTGKHIILY